MNLYKQFKTDEKLEQNGVPVNYGDGLVLTLRRAGASNPLFRAAAERHLKPRQHALKAMDEPGSRKLMAEVYADAVVAGWEGMKGPDEQPLEFTRDNVVKVLTDLPEFFKIVQRDAEEMTLFRAQEVASNAKNS